MRSLTIALTFLKDPRLFCQLLLWPLLLGVGLAAGPILISAAYLHLLEETPEQFRERVEVKDTTLVWIQRMLYGKQRLPAVPQVCQWIGVAGVERAPTSDCPLEPLDVVIHAKNGTAKNIDSFISYFSGATPRIHICETCNSELVIDFPNGVTTSQVQSLRAMGVVMLAQDNRNTDINSFIMQAKERSQQLEDLTGTVLLKADGMLNSMDLTHATTIMVLIINTCMLIVGSLWLILKGYRKVFRCFAENNALLPLVAVCGKWEFYLSIWIIALLRVALFLGIAIPIAYVAYTAAVTDETRNLFLPEKGALLSWLFATASSLALVTVIASLSELFRRHSMISFLYSYVPMVLILVSTGLWFYSLFSGDNSLSALQNGLTFLPIVGLSPVILTPILPQSTFSLICHGATACALVLILLKHHAIWFAAHLEEL